MGGRERERQCDARGRDLELPSFDDVEEEANGVGVYWCFRECISTWGKERERIERGKFFALLRGELALEKNVFIPVVVRVVNYRRATKELLQGVL